MGPYNSDSQARRIADKLDVAGYEVEKLPTMNRARASGLVKALLMERHPGKFGKYAKKFSKAPKVK